MPGTAESVIAIERIFDTTISQLDPQYLRDRLCHFDISHQGQLAWYIVLSDLQ
jgi:hypothetical protein